MTLSKIAKSIHPVFTLSLYLENFMCTAAEFIQVAEENGYKCVKNENMPEGAVFSFHFIGGKPTPEFIELANKLQVRFWVDGWEKKVIGE
jgi:hypothetical protein